MEQQILETESHAIRGIIKKMEDAWNAGNAEGFAAPMAENVDFVTIRADHLRGRPAVSYSHVDVLSTFYADSTNRFNVESLRLLRDDVALAHIRAVLESPTGPLKGRYEATYSLVLLKQNGSWEVTSFHITLATQTPKH